MKKLKDISKKQWGLISTSIGSILIIVGLLAMVGTQSGSTYAVSFEYCSCSGNYKRVGNKCVLQGLSDFNCCTGAGCTSSTGLSMCPGGVSCSVVQTVGAVQIKKCTYSDTTSCTCSDGDAPNSDGTCVIDDPPTTITLTATFGGQTASCTTTSGGSCLVNVPSGSNESGKTFLGWSKTTSCGGIVIGGTVSISQNTTYYPCYKSSNNNSGNSGGDSGNSGGNSGNSGGEPCYTAAFQVDGSVVNTITGKRNADDGGCEVTAPSYTCSSGSFKGWFTNPTVCNQDVSGTGAGNILTLNSNKTYYGCCYKSSGNSGNSGGNSGNSGGNSGNSGGNSGNSGGNSGNSGGGSGNSGGDSGNSGGGSGNSGGNSGNSGGGLGNADGGNNSSNVNNNPSTATKAPLVIALMGVMSLAFGVFTYWKNRKVTDM